MYRLNSSIGETVRAIGECSHCGLEFRRHSKEDSFCCTGCEYVYRLISDEDLGRFYELQGGKGQPIGSGVFAKRDYVWLDELKQQTEASESKDCQLELSLSGLSCVGCVWLVEALFKQADGAVFCRIDVQRGIMRIGWSRGRFDLVGFARRLQSHGYELSPANRKTSKVLSSIVWRMGVCGAFALNSMLYTLPGYLGMDDKFAFAVHFGWLSCLFATLSMAIGGSYFVARAFRAARSGVIHLDLPIAIGLTFAYGISLYGWVIGDSSLLYFDFVSTFVFLMLVGRWVQLVAIERNKSRLARYDVTAPKIEVLDYSGEYVTKDATELQVDEVYRIGAGDWAPVESTLRSNRAQMGMEWINGESEPSIFLEGGVVPSGARQLGTDSLEFVAREAWSTSLLKRLTDRKDEKSDTDRVAHVWISRYLTSILALALLGFFGWVLAGDIQTGIRVFVATLVISCPCALGIALPLADELTVAALRRKSVFLRSRSFWSRFSKVDAIAFDKTGTLTRLNLTLVNPEVLAKLGGKAVRVLSSLVADSPHPVCYSLRERMMASGIWNPIDDLDTSESIGNGMQGLCKGKTWRLGKASWALGISGEPRTCLELAGKVVAYFDFEDAPRSGALEELDSLRNRGLILRMLSGDAISRVNRLASLLRWELKSVFGEMSPQMKADWLVENDPDRFLMIGDGANDSLAFEAAACSGSPAVDQSLLSSRADFYYLGDGIQSARALFEARDSRRRTLRWLMSFAIGYNAFAAVFALSGWITPLLAAILMPASSIVSLAIVWMNLGMEKKSTVRVGDVGAPSP